MEGVTGPDAELIELVWMPLTDAKQLDMPAVTGVMLEELDARIADGFGHDLPVPFYSMPRGRLNGSCCDWAAYSVAVQKSASFPRQVRNADF